MRIDILPSAKQHRIKDAEIRAVISYPALTAELVARKAEAKLSLFIGPATTDEPWIEVIADLIDPDAAAVFHAMMLRRSTIAALGTLADQINPEYGRQRA